MSKTYLVGGISMAYPIILGAGVCKHPRHLIPYHHPDLLIGATEVGSATMEQRDGNEGSILQWPPTWTEFLEQHGGANSHGMPNTGIREFLEILDTVPLNIPNIVSIAGFSADEVAYCANLANANKQVAGIEVNWGCGNTGKIPDAYSLENARATLRSLEVLFRSSELSKPIWLKLSPYITNEERDELAERYLHIDFSAVPTVTSDFLVRMLQLIQQYPFVKAVVFSNTLANCRILGADGKPVTSPFDGKAGLSGPILKEISMRLIKRGLELVPPWCGLDFIAQGGVLTGDDGADYLDIGAKAFGCVSGPVWKNGPRFFSDLLESDRLLEHLM